jgi:hypothetical protein
MTLASPDLVMGNVPGNELFNHLCPMFSRQGDGEQVIRCPTKHRCEKGGQTHSLKDRTHQRTLAQSALTSSWGDIFLKPLQQQ